MCYQRGEEELQGCNPVSRKACMSNEVKRISIEHICLPGVKMRLQRDSLFERGLLGFSEQIVPHRLDMGMILEG